MADVSEMADVVAAVRRKRPYAIVSVALGEIADSRRIGPPCTAGGNHVCQTRGGRLAARSGLVPHLERGSTTLRSSIRPQHCLDCGRVCRLATGESPPPLEMAAAAAEAGCHGVLFDTFTKTGRGLLEWLPASELCELARQIHSSGQFVALAGQVSADDLPELSVVDADIVAIRSAACAQGRNERNRRRGRSPF